MIGAVCGDILGSPYEFNNSKYDDLSQIEFFREESFFTDDTAMTLAVADWLMNDIDKAYYDDETLKLMLAKKFVYYATDKFLNEKLGFGGRFRNWCIKGMLIQEYDPINSYGNGSGMRVSPVGWYFDTMEETMRFAKISADVTHNHPEGQKGAMCIAAAIFLARNGKSKQEIKDYLMRAFGYLQLNKSVAELREECEWSDICQDTVPMSVVAFLDSTDYESAVRLAISYGSDSDTIADMAGAIAEAYYGEIPEEIVEFCLSKLYSDDAQLCRTFKYLKHRK